MSEHMTKIRIITPQSLSSRVIDTLYGLSLFHVKQHENEYNLQSGSPLAQAEQLSSTLLKTKTVQNELCIELLSNEHNFGKKDFAFIEKLHRELQEIKTKEQELQTQLRQTTEAYEISTALDSLGIERILVHKLKYVSYFIGFCNPDIFRAKLKVVHELKHTTVGQKPLIALIVQKKDEKAVQSILQECAWSSLILEQHMTTSAALKRNIAQLNAEIKVQAQRKANLKTNSQFIVDMVEFLECEIKKAELPLQFATTAQSFVATGFVPTQKLSLITKKLEQATHKRITIEELHVDHHESVPVKLAHKPAVQNFEVLTRLYELPSYFEADPTALLFITFPLFFGIMLGDVGYGLVMLAVFLLLRKRKQELKQWCNVLIYASIVSVLFGFVFGEYFGFEHVSAETGTALCEKGFCLAKDIVEKHGALEVVYTFPRLLNRAHGTVAIGSMKLLSILALCIFIGALHVNLGLIIGFFNVYKAHGLRLAVLEKLSWLVFEFGLALLVLAIASVIPLHWFVGTAIMLIAAVGLYLGEGPKGIIEIPALFSNMLSYMRLGAVGLASVGLAAVVNENLALPMLEKGGVFIIFGILIMFLGHGINMLLGIIGPFLHSVRLHYVECFSKFFHGGGIEYIPFGKKAQTGGEL